MPKPAWIKFKILINGCGLRFIPIRIVERGILSHLADKMIKYFIESISSPQRMNLFKFEIKVRVWKRSKANVK